MGTFQTEVYNFLSGSVKIAWFGSDDAATAYINTPSPIGHSPFYGYELVHQIKHLINVELHEAYPMPGRIWSNTYDPNRPGWYGWKVITPSNVT